MCRLSVSRLETRMRRESRCRTLVFDALSGMAGVYVNDELYTTLQNGEFSLRIDRNTCTTRTMWMSRWHR